MQSDKNITLPCHSVLKTIRHRLFFSKCTQAVFAHNHVQVLVIFLSQVHTSRLHTIMHKGSDLYHHCRFRKPFAQVKKISDCTQVKQIAPKCTDLPPSAQIAHKSSKSFFFPKCTQVKQIAPKPGETQVSHSTHVTQCKY